MANIALHLGSAGLTIVLFVAAMLLAIEDNDAWGKFFVLGVYLGTWNAIYAVTRRAASLLVKYVKDPTSAAMAVLFAYGGALVLSALITWFVASRLITFVGVPLQ